MESKLCIRYLELKTNIMKNKMCLYLLILSLSFLNHWTMQSQISLNHKKPQESKTDSQTVNQISLDPERKIKYYRVEETVNLKFGGYKTKYDVSNTKLIDRFDLGPNGTRTITPVYEEIRNYVPIVKNIPAPKQDTIFSIKNPIPSATNDNPKTKDTYTYIDIIKTYEKVAEKGYESIDMLKKIGNAHYFNSNFEKAEKCYTKLFSITTNLEPEYYYRYSVTLKSVGNIQKSDEILKKFNLLSGISSR